MATTVFQGIKAKASYETRCAGCGKPLRRSVSVEHTINPFNRNAAGHVKSPSEVRDSAQTAATEQAKQLNGAETLCRECEEKPMRELLIVMAAEPKRDFPEPEPFWNSPMQTLEDRKHVERHYEACKCGSACCSGYTRAAGFRITRAGLERASKFKPSL